MGLFVLNAAGYGESLVSALPEAGGIILASAERAIPLVASDSEYPGVLRMLTLLQKDIEAVTGNRPPIFADGIPGGQDIVLVGTLDRSPLIGELVRAGKLPVDGLAGKWDSYILQVVDKPFPSVHRALVIVGSNKRGTLYGMFELSKQIGVSPWVWWADVPPKRKETVYIRPGLFKSGEPAVKYRGIFLNDEEPALGRWAVERYGGFNSVFYEKVFELMLRLRANYIWPAMWWAAFSSDDAQNPELADELGIVVGTTHHEPMMRAHAEWKANGEGAWNYETNEARLRQFWTEGIERMGDRESIVTLAMRGDGDMAMSEETNIALLEDIVADQRQIIEEVTGKKADQTPQLWALYKEVQDYYDKGMTVPEDVTLLLCDDNWGNVRRLPRPDTPPRSGGYGMYYHFDFVGGPRNHKWLNTSPLPRIWEQMHLCYEHGVNRIWIVNVGDLKPMELPISFFLDYAWNPKAIPAESLPEYTRSWAEQQFGPKHAETIAGILSAYTKFNSRRKPEMLDRNTYSLMHYREWERVVSQYKTLLEQAETIGHKLPAEYRDAYYQLVLHPVRACANLYEMRYAEAKNRLFAEQGRAATKNMADRVERLFEKDRQISQTYNQEISGGKWNHMMDQTHISYTYWQQPEKDVVPKVLSITLPAEAEMGVAVEGETRWWPGEINETETAGETSEPNETHGKTGDSRKSGDRETQAEKGETTERVAQFRKDAAVLPEMDGFRRQSCFIEVFNRGTEAFDFKAESSVPWLLVRPESGTVDKEMLLNVSVDWAAAPKGVHKIPIRINGAGRQVTVTAVVNNPPSPIPQDFSGYIEERGVVSMEAPHYSRKVETDNIHWQVIPGLSRTDSGVTPMPVTSGSQNPGENSPRLEYDMLLFTEGEVEVSTFWSPTQDFLATGGLRYGVSFDDETVRMVNIHENDTIPDWKYPQSWNEAVGRNIKVKKSRHTIRESGARVLKIWMVDPGFVLQKIVVNTGGLKPSYLGPPESMRCGIDHGTNHRNGVTQ